MIRHCKYCDRPVDFKRKIGFGTIVMIFLTGFIWILAIPLYRKRCKICGGTEYKNLDHLCTTNKK